jgi:hypothetical protein
LCLIRIVVLQSFSDLQVDRLRINLEIKIAVEAVIFWRWGGNRSSRDSGSIRQIGAARYQGNTDQEKQKIFLHFVPDNSPSAALRKHQEDEVRIGFVTQGGAEDQAPVLRRPENVGFLPPIL